MTYQFKRVIVIIGCFFVSFFQAHSLHVPMRTPLLTKSARDHKSTILTSSQGFCVIFRSGKKIKRYDSYQQHLCLSVFKGMLVVDDLDTLTDRILITPKNGMFLFEGQEYVGSVSATSTKKIFSLTHYSDDQQHAYHASQAICQGLNNVADKKRTADKSRGILADVAVHRHPYNVRVLLDEHDYYNNEPWVFYSKGGFAVIDPDDTTTPIDYYGQDIKVKEKNGHIWINGRIYTQRRIYLIPQEGHITFDDNSYVGAFLLSCYNNKLLLINSLDIEDYVYSVLKSESWPGWPLEVNKAFAIASRSYVIAMVFRARASKLPYHIKNTSIHQNYNGHHDTPLLHQAVEETRGMFLSYKKQPIIAMFDICCGGVIPAKVHDIDFSKAPYLARPYACTFCKGCKNYSWRAVYSLDSLNYLFKNDFSSLRGLKTIKIAHKDNAGLVKRVSLHGHRRTVTTSGKQVRSLCKKIKSICFTIARNGDDFIFNGRGRGHHMGICQWGAREMVRQGYDYKEVLAYYYPKTSFMKLG